MIFANSQLGFKSFLGKSAEGCADFGHVVAFLGCILLPQVARRSVHAVGRAIRSELRNADNLLRFLGGSNSSAVLLDDAHQRDQRQHVLLIDSTMYGHQCVLAFCYLKDKRRERLTAGGDKERAYWQDTRRRCGRGCARRSRRRIG